MGFLQRKAHDSHTLVGLKITQTSRQYTRFISYYVTRK